MWLSLDTGQGFVTEIAADLETANLIVVFLFAVVSVTKHSCVRHDANLDHRTAGARSSGSLEMTVLVLQWQASSHRLACMCTVPDLDTRPGIMDMNAFRSARVSCHCTTRTV